MKSKITILNLMVLFLLAAVLTCSAAGATDDQVIVLGRDGVYDLHTAMQSLSQNAGNAVIYLNGPVTLNRQLEIPIGLTGLKSVTLASYDGEPVQISMGGSVICANGIPLTLEKGVNLNNGFLVGGYCVGQYDTETAEDSLLIINGFAEFVIGGGLAMNPGAVSSVKNVNIILNGSSNNVHGGGYAFNGGVADVSNSANLILTKSSSVYNAVYAGGYAAGQGSSAPVAVSHVIPLGTVNNIYLKNGLAENGGTAEVGTYNIELLNPRIQPTRIPPVQPTPTAPVQPFPVYPYQPVSPVPTATVMYIGPGQQARNFTDAVNLLPQANAGNVEFRLMGDFRQETDVVIPSNRGILSLTITGNNNTRMTVSWPEDVGFFANGIPTTIASSVHFSDGVIYGGANTGSGQQSNLQSTYLDIAGKVNKVVAGSKAKGSAASAHVVNTTLIFRGKATGWLYGGGAALYGGYSAVDGTAHMTVMQGASLDLSIAGGGYAFGAGSESAVKDSVLDVSGSVIYAVFLGGYADQSSSAVTTGQAFLNLQAAGNIGQSVWYGGRAYNKSRVTVDTASATISGRVGATVHYEGRASDGGSVSVRVIK